MKTFRKRLPQILLLIILGVLFLQFYTISPPQSGEPEPLMIKDLYDISFYLKNPPSFNRAFSITIGGIPCEVNEYYTTCWNKIPNTNQFYLSFGAIYIKEGKYFDHLNTTLPRKAILLIYCYEPYNFTKDDFIVIKHNSGTTKIILPSISCEGSYDTKTYYIAKDGRLFLDENLTQPLV